MEWISVKDRLPEHLEKILIVYEGSDNVLMANYKNGLVGMGFYVYYADGRMLIHTPVTHWMPLPEPPKNLLK
jgi:hypothetical protein